MRSKEKIAMECRRTKWHGRPAHFLANDRLALCFLLGGGHLASLSSRTGLATGKNLLWEANWSTIDPDKYSQRTHARKYGPPPAGRFLSGFTGHALCLGYFGAPSYEETKLGLPLHGEAASSRWTAIAKGASKDIAALKLRVNSPVAGLRFERDISIRSGESVAYVDETLTNQQRRDTYFQWVQHATFGPPLLSAHESVCLLPGSRSKSWPLGYEGKCALKDDSEFDWPNAPGEDGKPIDLCQPFPRDGRGFVAATLLDKNLELGYVAVLNWRLGLIAGCLFCRNDFPWVAIWEENRVRTGPPWNGKTQARGVEFGTSPMPLGLRSAIEAGPMFGVPTVRCLPARCQLKASYVIFVTEAPPNWRTISAITASDKAIAIVGPHSQQTIALPAAGIGNLKSNRQRRSAKHAAAR